MNLKVCYSCGFAFTPSKGWDRCPDCGASREDIERVERHVRYRIRQIDKEVKHEAT